MTNKHRVGLLELATGALRVVPRLHIANKGLLGMALTKPGQRKSIGQHIEKWAKKRPDHPAVIDAVSSYTYGRFNEKANRIASVLRRCGIKRNVGVGILMENRAELLLGAAAAIKLGGVGVMLNYNQRGEVLLHSLRITEPRALIVGTECREAFESVRDQLPAELRGNVFWLADPANDGAPIEGLRDLESELAGADAANPPEMREISSSDPAFDIFTSGTTGLPKAAIMSHARWLKAMYGVGLASLRMRGDDIFYCPLPLYHNNALTLSWGACLASGATMAISRKFSASRFWEEVEQFNATAFCYIGELCRYLLAQPPHAKERTHRLRVALGNGLRPELWPEFRKRFRIGHINEFYGASEGNLLFTNVFDIEPSCGFTPLPYQIVRCDPETEAPVRDAQGRMVKVRIGEAGLLINKITNRVPFDGYTDRKESEKKLFRDVFKKGDAYFNTGDLVRRMGFFHIQFVDRLGDTFRWKGENVATTEVEKVLNEFPQIHEGVVYGVEVPGNEGRAGMASLTLKPGVQLDGAALAEFLCDNLPAYAVPLFLRLSEQHATTSTFKVQKTTLKKEGFDPNRIDEPLYMLDEAEKRYVPLTASRYSQITGKAVAVKKGREARERSGVATHQPKAV